MAGFFGLNWSDPQIDQTLKYYEENLTYEIIYLAEAFNWGFSDIWSMPTAMRKRFIDTYEEILKIRKEKAESNNGSTGVSPPSVFKQG